MTSAIVVGSGPNGLAAGLTLAAEGVDVTILEAAGTLGGGTRSSELTGPGLIHDECSAAHPLALDTPFSRRFDLTEHGLVWHWPDVQYSHPLDRGGAAAAYRSVEQTAAGLGYDDELWRTLFEPLAQRFDDIAADFMRPMLRVPDHPLLMVEQPDGAQGDARPGRRESRQGAAPRRTRRGRTAAAREGRHLAFRGRRQPGRQQGIGGPAHRRPGADPLRRPRPRCERSRCC